MRIPNPLTPIGALVDRIEGSGRRHRRSWLGADRAHIEVKGVHRAGLEDLARHVEKALEEIPSVHWAEVNAVAGSVVVAFDPGGADVDDLVDVIEAVEDAHGLHDERFPADRPEHPGDIEPLRRNAIAAGADVLGLGVSLFGRVLQFTPVPAEVASVVALVEHQPRVRKILEHRIGYAATDLGLGLANAMAQALTQGPLGLTASLGHRASIVGEVSAARGAWERREPELAGRRHDVPLAALEYEGRPTPLPGGPVEHYADRAAFGSIGAFGVGLAVTRSPRRAANVLIAGIPRASTLGREVFAAHFGRALAGRDVLVLDRQVLRRLDRIDTVVLDAQVMATGRLVVAEVEVLGDLDPDAVARGSAVALEIEQVGGSGASGGWRLAPLNSSGTVLPRGGTNRARLLGHRGGTVRAVVHDGVVVGLVVVVPELDPLAAALATSARRAGHLLIVSGERGTVGSRLDADRVVPGGRRLAPAIRALQEEGRVVLLVSGGEEHRALRMSDCGIGVTGHGAHPPWGAHLLTARGLEDAWLVVEAASVARDVSRRSARLSLVGSSVGGAWAMVGPSIGSGRRAAMPVQAAALVAEASGLASAVTLARRRAPVTSTAAPWHAMDPEAVLAAMGSSPEGLDDAEVVVRRPPVQVTVSRPARLVRAVAGELINPLTPVLAVGAGMAAAVGSVSDALLVGGTVVANAVVSGGQRVRAELSIERLYRVSETLVIARRGEREVALRPGELVRGDVLDLVAGDVVPADCRILEALSCEVDESVLTGESLPVVKQATATPGVELAERACMLFEGTNVVAGSALGVVVAIGQDTEAGRALAGAPEAPPSGVEARLAALTRATIPFTLAGGAAVTGLSLLRGRPVRDAVGTGVSLMVAAVPEGLPLLATVAQLSAAQRLSARNALVRNPRTIEALGRVDVLCFDKTGTLTAGRIGLRQVSDGVHDEPLDALGGPCRAVLAGAVRASPALEDDEETLPHATDQAVVEAAEEAGVSPGEGIGGWRQIGELAFDSTRGFSAAVGTGAAGAVVAVKGAPETILPRCDRWHSPNGVVTMTPGRRAQLDAEVERLAAKGLRILAVAERESSTRAELDEERVSGMSLLGFLGFADHVRPTAATAIGELRRAGVDIVMITGDHPSTAEAIARELSILNGHRVVTGSELDAVDDDALVEWVSDVSVFARVTPAHKVRIVRALQAAGRVVAMTGDGANDAAAIRLAHTGIALGRRGSPSARDAADLVVTDDRIETIIDAIVEGRAMWASVRDALAILLGGNLGEIGFTVGATALTGASPLSPRQLLLVNLLTDMLPAMAIALRPPIRRSPEDLLHEGPEASLGGPLLRQIALRAVTTASGAGGAWLVARSTGTRRRAGTVALAALVGTQLGQTAVVGGTSPVVLASTVVSGAVLVAIVQTPGVSHFFGCTPLGPVGWGIAAGSSAVATSASVVLPWAARRIRPAW
jgi:cation-transporting ATPase I